MVGNLNFNGTLITLKYAFDPIELGHTRHIDLSKALIQRPIHHFTPQMVLHINPFLPILGIIGLHIHKGCPQSGKFHHHPVGPYLYKAIEAFMQLNLQSKK